MKTEIWVQVINNAVYISNSADKFEKIMKPAILPQAMGV